MMAGRQRVSCILRLLSLGLIAIAGVRMLDVVFMTPVRAASSRVMRHAAFESGKVNVGVEKDEEAPVPPQPVLDCDEGCMTAIFDCIDEGCSVDALLKLDQKLAEDEQTIATTMEELKTVQKTSFSAENAGTLAWLGNFLGRSGSLRAQLQALRGMQDSDFVKQMVKAASVAFGGGRPNNYPSVGVSSYSESPP
mmetsp:Transcript_98435/g.278782  ORF Transcript_98435/g.278782 Transcript_98435/m.278782 type:complete len:194 (-) Transcript_98435:70-651(-)